MEVGKVNAYTKNGNPYHKTSAGKKIGTLAGLGVGCYSTYKFAELVKVTEGVPVKDFLKTLAKVFPLNLPFVKSIVGWGVVGLAAGAVVDWAVNKVRKHKADKAAAAQEAQ